MARKMWTAAEVAAAACSLSRMSTEDIAAQYGVRVKALRSMLRRHGISIRYMRKSAIQRRRDCRGLKVRRPTLGSAASYGAAALANLPDSACRWPIGEPSDPDFCFCGLQKGPGESYCKAHRARAYGPLPAELIGPAKRILSMFKLVTSSNGKKAALQSGAHIDGRAPRTSS